MTSQESLIYSSLGVTQDSVYNNTSMSTNLLNLLSNYNCSYYDNYEDCMNSSINSSSTNSTDDPTTPPKYWAFILILFPMFTLFGNILVVLSVFKEKQLQNMTNYFIVSLAIADLGVAMLVMPLAVYVEVMNGLWTFNNDALCDAWVAFDVTFCTASILNLTAISVDRFMAVTMPIRYSRQKKNNNRVYITIAIVWLISIGIGSPIALGANKTADRVPELCIFYNSDFLIWSSLGSFYIPCIVMIILYWRIFKVIHERSKKSLASKNKIALASSAASKITKDVTTDIKNATEMTTVNDTEKVPFKNGLADVAEEGSSNQTDDPDPEYVRSPTIESEIWVRRESWKQKQNYECEHAQINAVDSCESSPQLNHENKQKQCDDKEGKKRFAGLKFPLFQKNGENGHHPPGETVVYADQAKGKHKTVVKFRFQFHLPKRGKKTKKDLRSSRERKATKTLAIVLGAFLFCWVPFFTVNVINAFCIRYDLKIGACNLEPVLQGTFLWLGYLNSFLNPVIYTIFNLEFRKAFNKLLRHPCK